MHVQLRVISGPFVGEAIQISRPKFIIGREQDCHLRPDSEFVSRHHCVLLLDEYTLRIRDLGSKNGTYVNGRRITGEVVLCHDDMISLGEMTMQVDLVAAQLQRAGAEQQEALNPALLGTDVFDGNTLPAADPNLPAASSAQPPASSTEDTQHMPQPNPNLAAREVTDR